MNPDAYELLQRYYRGYRDQLELQRKLKGDSALLSSLGVKNNVRYRILADGAIARFKVDSALLDELIQHRYVRQTAKVSDYTITARGIWEVEQREGILTPDLLVSHIDKKEFDLFGGEARLTERDKVIVLALIAARAFTEKSCVDLLKDRSTTDGWREILERSFELLKSLRIVSKLDNDELFRAKGNEQSVSNLVRHTDTLPRKTRGLFVAKGRQRYHLNLVEFGALSVDGLSFLFQAIFEGRLPVEGIDTVFSFCRDVAYGDSIHVFDMASHEFAKPSYDGPIREGLSTSLIWQD